VVGYEAQGEQHVRLAFADGAVRTLELSMVMAEDLLTLVD
jgi:hypothetical protein